MKKFLLLFVFSTLLLAIAFPQDTLTKKELRKQQSNFLLTNRPWSAEVPIWIPGFAGSFAYGDIDIEGEDGNNPENPIEPPGGVIGEIISRAFSSNWYFRFVFLTRIAYENNRYLVQFDGLTGSVGNSTKFNYNNQEIVKATFRTTNMRLFGGYKIIQTESKNNKFRYELFGYIGARMYIQHIYSELNGLVNKLDIHPLWAEPIIGVQNQFTFERWLIVLQADYGGFFVDTRYSTVYSGFAYYRMGKSASLKFGWNHLYLNHTGSILNETFHVKVTLSGPSVGITFHF